MLFNYIFKDLADPAITGLLPFNNLAKDTYKLKFMHHVNDKICLFFLAHTGNYLATASFDGTAKVRLFKLFRISDNLFFFIYLIFFFQFQTIIL